MRDDPTVEFRNATDLVEPSLDGSRDPLDRLAEEFAERCRNGDSPLIAEYEARNPADAPRVRKLLEAVVLMEQLRHDSHRSRSMPERLGEFRIIRELGRGGMGVVYEASQESLGRSVAVKAIHHIHMDPKRLQRFRLEAQAIARLHHTNIVPIFGVGEDDGLPYYAMQYIRGNGLDVLIDEWRASKAPPALERWRMIAGFGVQAAEALHYAHEQGVLHRDIKPANLLIDENQAVWITDFGLAKFAGREDLTDSGDVIGTLRYLAPESLRGESDARSDVYSLGLTLYELLTLELPFGELSASELLRHVSEGDLTLPRRLQPTIPRDLETIVLKAIAREPGHRYRSAHALADDLRRFLEDRPIRARRVTTIERVWRWSRRNRMVAALIATAAASFVLAACVGWIGYVKTTRALERANSQTLEAQAATRRSQANVKLSLEVFGDLFEKLAPPGQIASPPLGMLGRRRADSPDDRGHRPGRGAIGGGLGFDGPDGLPPDGFFAGGLGRRGGPRPGDEHGLSGGTPNGEHGPPDGGPPGSPRLGSSETNSSLLGSILNFYDRFARQNAGNKDPKLQGEAAWAYLKVGALYHNLGREDEAAAAYERAIAMFEELIPQQPDDPEIPFKLVASSIMSDPWLADPATLETMEQRLTRARELIAELAEGTPESFNYAQARLQVEAKLGVVLQRLDRHKEAEACYRKGVELADGLVARSPKLIPWRLDRVAILEALAGLQIGDGRREDALKELAAATADLHFLDSQRRMTRPIADHVEKLSKMYEMLGETKRVEEMTQWADSLGSRLGNDHRPPPEDGPR